MSRSSPPRSSIAARLRQRAHADERDSPATSLGRSARRLAIRFAKLVRWLHIYVSMFGLAAVLFFSVTGVTLNHPDWFFGDTQRSVQAEGRCRPEVAAPRRPSGLDRRRARPVARRSPSSKSSSTCGKPTASAGRSPTSGSTTTECVVTFKGPGYAADAFIDRESGHYTVTQSYHGVVAIINDLHKGRDTGPAWSILIDVSAVLLTLISLTGLVLLFYLKLRRVPGLIVVDCRDDLRRGALFLGGPVRTIGPCPGSSFPVSMPTKSITA